MTAPAVVGPGKPPRVLSGDEWQQAQYAPHRTDEQQDPTKPMAGGRALTGDEWEQSQRAPDFSALKFPAMPKIASDRLGTTGGSAIPGQYDMRPSPERQAGAAVRSGSAALDIAAPSFGAGGALIAHSAAAVGRQVVAPAVENPALTAAMVNPVGAIVGFGMAAHTIAKYGWQQAHEAFMSPEDKAKAEADPDRVSGEAAAVQAVMFGLGTLAGVHGLSKVADVSEGMTEAGAKGLSGFNPSDARETAQLQPYFTTTKGAEVLGTAAAAHGVPETANPYPPATFLEQAWKEGHASATQPAAAPSATPEGFTPEHFAEYRKSLDASGLRVITPEEALSMSPEDLRDYADKAKAAEKSLSAQALDPETLKKFNAAERKANSSVASNEETDAAVKVMQDIEDRMTPHQRLLMYGHRSVDYTSAEDASAMADAAERTSPETFLQDEQSGHPVPSQNLLSDVGRLITTGNANLGHNIEHPASLIQLKGTIAELMRRGMTPDEIIKSALEQRINRGYASPEQATEIARSTLEKLRKGGYFGARPEPSPQSGQRLLGATSGGAEPTTTAPAVESPTAPEPAGAPTGAGPAYRGPTPLYGRLSNDALGAEYRALIEKRTAEQPNAQAPLWTPEREAQAVEEIENRRRPDGSLSTSDKRALTALQSAQGEEYYVGRHTPETAAAERRVAQLDKHITAIETEMAGRGIKPEEAMQPPAPAGEGGAPQPVEGTGEVKTRGLSAGIEAKAVEHGMEPLDMLPEYRSLNMADQAQRAVQFIAENPDQARRVALGEANAPEGLHPVAVTVAVENKALAEGDVATIRDLAASRMTEQTTTAAQHLRLLGERDPDSPVGAIQRIEEARGGKTNGKAISDAVTELRGHLDAASATIDESAWTKFIDSIRC